MKNSKSLIVLVTPELHASLRKKSTESSIPVTSAARLLLKEWVKGNIFIMAKQNGNGEKE